jgi:hypothetical protein
MMSWWAALGGVVGQTVDDLGGVLAGLLVDALALDGDDLADVGEVEVVVECGGGPDGARFQAPVLQAQRFAEVRLAARGEVQADVGGQGGLMVLGDEQRVGAAGNHMLSDLALGEQGIGGDGLAADVERFEQRDGQADRMGLLELIAGAYG